MSGLVKFEYPMPFSRLREAYLVTYLENEVVAEMLRTQSTLTAHLMPMAIKSRNMIKETFDTYKAYSEILLPTGKKQAKLEDMTSVQKTAIKDKLKSLRELLLKKS